MGLWVWGHWLGSLGSLVGDIGIIGWVCGFGVIGWGHWGHRLGPLMSSAGSAGSGPLGRHWGTGWAHGAQTSAPWRPRVGAVCERCPRRRRARWACCSTWAPRTSRWRSAVPPSATAASTSSASPAAAATPRSRWTAAPCTRDTLQVAGRLRAPHRAEGTCGAPVGSLGHLWGTHREVRALVGHLWGTCGELGHL